MPVDELIQHFKEAAERGEGGSGVNMVVGGVELADLQQAYAQHPPLARWQRTSLRLLGDLTDANSALQRGIEELEAVCLEQAKRIKDLEAGAKGKGEGAEGSEGGSTDGPDPE